MISATMVGCGAVAKLDLTSSRSSGGGNPESCSPTVSTSALPMPASVFYESISVF